MKRFLFVSFLFLQVYYASQAFATVNELQEQRAEQFCQSNSNYCK